MLVLPNYAKHYASEIDKSLAESRTCSTKDLTLFMKRLSRVRKNRARAKDRLCLKGVRQRSEMSNFCLTQGRSQFAFWVVQLYPNIPLQSVIFIFPYCYCSFKEIVLFKYNKTPQRRKMQVPSCGVTLYSILRHPVLYSKY